MQPKISWGDLLRKCTPEGKLKLQEQCRELWKQNTAQTHWFWSSSVENSWVKFLGREFPS